MSVAQQTALERIGRITGAVSEPPEPPIPWRDRLVGFATGDYRNQRNSDVARLEQVERSLGVERGGPHSFFVRPQDIGLNRALTVSSLPGGGYLVETKNDLNYQPYAQPVTHVVDIVDHLVLPPGSGPIAVPTGASSLTPTYQVTETSGPTDSTLNTGQVNATPHTLIATVSRSRLLGQQSSPGIDGVLDLELKRNVRAFVSSATFGGSGVDGQPHGVLGTPNVGTSSAGTIAYSNIVAAQQAVANANGIFDPSRVACAAAPDTAALLMQRFTSPRVVPLWEGNINVGSVVGVPAFATKSAPASTLLYGDFSTVLLVIWGGIEILVDPFMGPNGSNFTAGLVSVRIALTFDVVVRRPTSFYTLTSVS